MRDKLIELLSENFAKFGGLVTIKGEAELLSLYLEAEKVADHLISHGVTVQRWIPVSESLPEKFQIVLRLRNCRDAFGFECVMRNGGWLNDDVLDAPVTHWMPLPELPKEGE